MSRLCLTLTEKTLEDAVLVYKKYESEIDLIELRVDFLDSSEHVKLCNYKFNKPVILTFRKEVDGGQYSGDESYRQKILLNALKTGNFSYVDLEEDLKPCDLDKVAAYNSVRVIRSFHDFKGVPSNFSDRINKLKRNSSEIPKAAVMINNSSDLLEFYKELDKIDVKDKIVLGMGKYGFNTRVLAGKIGSYLTFCSKDGESAAPGHVSPTLLNNVYNFKNINSETKLFGIIGNPVMHTKSPAIHNGGYKKLDLNAVYVPFETDCVKTFIELAKLINIEGFSVTVPFKSEIIDFMDSTTDSVQKIGACNTVCRVNSSWIGDNTDYIGFINPLKASYGSLEGKNVSVIGAGGSAKASIYALKEAGANVLILNRTLSKAKELAELFSCKYAPLNVDSSKVISEYSDVIIQNTNVGMHPLENINPFDFYTLTGSEFLYDVIYTPEVTKFLEKGNLSGCKTLNGWEMLEQQGYRQFKLFTGFDYLK